jgi:hypothetical protein
MARQFGIDSGGTEMLAADGQPCGPAPGAARGDARISRGGSRREVVAS